MRANEFTLGTYPERPGRSSDRPKRGHQLEPQFKIDVDDDELDERGKASHALCTGGLPDADLSKSDLDSCKSQGLRARDTNSKFTLTPGGKPVSIKGKKVKGKKYGGPLPDYTPKKKKNK